MYIIWMSCLVPFPRLHCLTLSHLPFLQRNTKSRKDYKVSPSLSRNHNANRIIGDVRILNVVLVYRGSDEKAIRKMSECTLSVQQEMADYFAMDTWN